MLNKIRVVGEVLPIKIKKKDDFEDPKREARVYFSLKVPNPSGSLTILRCLAQGNLVERIEQEISEGGVVEVRGYLRSEKEGRQILIRVVDFNKLDLKLDEVDKKQSNQVRLIGKINHLGEIREHKFDLVVLDFQIFVPRGEVVMVRVPTDQEQTSRKIKNLSNFFC